MLFPACLAPIRTTSCLADELDRFESHYGTFSDRRKRNENTGRKALADIDIVKNMPIRPVLSRKRYIPFLDFDGFAKGQEIKGLTLTPVYKCDRKRNQAWPISLPPLKFNGDRDRPKGRSFLKLKNLCSIA